MAERALFGKDDAAAIDVAGKVGGQFHQAPAWKWTPSRLVLREPLCVGDKAGHFRAVVGDAAAEFAALKALLDALLESDDFFFAFAIERKHAGNACERHGVGHCTAADVAMRAAHLVSDVGGGVLRRVVEDLQAEPDTVAEGTLGYRRGIRRGPGLGRARGFRLS